LVLATLGSYLSPFVDPSKTSLFAFLGLAYPFLFLLNLIAILFWLFVKPRNGLLSILTLLIGGNAICNYIGVNTPNVVKKEVLTIATFNIQNAAEGRGRNVKEYKINGDIFKNFLKKFAQVDVFCIQEQSHYGNDLVEGALDYKYSHQIKNKGTIIYSKLPIKNAGEIDFKSNSTSCIWADIEFKDQTCRVYCAHLHSNQITEETEKVIEDVAIEEETLKGLYGILRKYSKYTKRRALQAKLIQEHIEKSPNPVILTGDFNDTPQSYVYRQMSKGLKDSFKEVGGGFGSTFNGSIPGLRIDYILGDQSFDFISYEKITENKSDHYPVIAKLRLD